MKKVNLISYHSREEYPAKHSLSSLRLGSFISKSNEVLLSHYSLEDSDEYIASDLKKSDAEFIALPAYKWNIQKTANISRLLGSRKKIIGGPETRNHDNYNWSNNETYILGEGEEMLEKICNGQKIGKQVIESQPCSLDQYEIPLFSKKFNEIEGENFINENFTFWETSRGCAYDCAFCNHKKRGGIRYFDENFLEKEVKNFKENHIKRAFIVDPSLGGNRKRGKYILELLNKHSPQTAITAYMRTEYLDGQFIDLLEDANIEEILIGIQTLNRNVSNFIRKNDYQKIESILPNLKSRGIKWRAELIVGLPGDNIEGLKNSLKYSVEELKPKTLYAYHLTVLENTPLFQHLNNFNSDMWVTREETTKKVTQSISYSTKELKKMLEIAGGITSLYRFLERREWFGEENKFRNFEKLEDIVYSLTKNNDIKNIFRKRLRNQSEEIWEKYFKKI